MGWLRASSSKRLPKAPFYHARDGNCLFRCAWCLQLPSCYGSRLSKASAAGALSALQDPRALNLHDFEEKLSVRILGLSNIAGFVSGSRRSALRGLWFETYPQPNTKVTSSGTAKLAEEVVIDKSGRFDFGDLKPGEYDLQVTYPGEDAVGFGFVIDPAAHSTDVLIDVSPAYYCNCCGWNFELR